MGGRIKEKKMLSTAHFLLKLHFLFCCSLSHLRICNTRVRQRSETASSSKYWRTSKADTRAVKRDNLRAGRNVHP